MTRRLSPATYGRTLAFHMRAAEPPRDRRHTVLLAMQWVAALLAAVGLAAIAIHSIADRVIL